MTQRRGMGGQIWSRGYAAAERIGPTRQSMSSGAGFPPTTNRDYKHPLVKRLLPSTGMAQHTAVWQPAKATANEGQCEGSFQLQAVEIDTPVCTLRSRGRVGTGGALFPNRPRGCKVQLNARQSCLEWHNSQQPTKHHISSDIALLRSKPTSLVAWHTPAARMYASCILSSNTLTPSNTGALRLGRSTEAISRVA